MHLDTVRIAGRRVAPDALEKEMIRDAQVLALFERLRAQATR